MIRALAVAFVAAALLIHPAAAQRGGHGGFGRSGFVHPGFVGRPGFAFHPGFFPRRGFVPNRFFFGGFVRPPYPVYPYPYYPYPYYPYPPYPYYPPPPGY
jgi:hypothetical protein